jgi:flagellar biosynthesis GTPase FlhF
VGGDRSDFRTGLNDDDAELQLALAISLSEQEEAERITAQQEQATNLKKRQEEEEEETRRILQEEMDAIAAAELQAQEEEEVQRLAALTQRSALNARTRALRQFLEEDIPLPARVEASVNDSVDQDLLDLVMKRSVTDTGRSQHGYQPLAPAPAPVRQPAGAILRHAQPDPAPYYDEDDEMLARALQESLNGF